MFPTLIFFYGPNQGQLTSASQALAKNIGYSYSPIPPNVNIIVESFNKSCDYVINGLFLSVEDIKILEEYFNFRIIHFQHDTIEHPEL